MHILKSYIRVFQCRSGLCFSLLQSATLCDRHRSILSCCDLTCGYLWVTQYLYLFLLGLIVIFRLLTLLRLASPFLFIFLGFLRLLPTRTQRVITRELLDMNKHLALYIYRGIYFAFWPSLLLLWDLFPRPTTKVSCSVYCIYPWYFMSLYLWYSFLFSSY